MCVLTPSHTFVRHGVREPRQGQEAAHGAPLAPTQMSDASVRQRLPSRPYRRLPR